MMFCLIVAKLSSTKSMVKLTDEVLIAKYKKLMDFHSKFYCTVQKLMDSHSKI